jgi:hypothetical protein
MSRKQFRRRATSEHPRLRPGVARPTANLGEHLHRSLNLDFLAGKRRNRCMIPSPLLIEPSHPLRD